MSASRTLATALFGLLVAFGAQAAENAAFSVLQQDGNGKPLVFQSTGALKKGDVIKVNAVNAQPVLVLQMAMCDSDCAHPRLVQTLPLTAYYAGQASSSHQFVLPEDGHVSFWVQRLGDLPSEPINTPNGAWSVQYVDPFLRFASKVPYQSVQPMPATAVSLDDNTLRARFFHRTFVTVSLADTDH
ncbi:hypothetical protein [Dyella acidisoli]|uniref:Uncharacterized protein n=1 Tax=Dyella acidisoli TaxID=1867834 RepID=A0ABQ5XR40_9GAMM|nr:hypothetical protein [Dyella acidisoli]GLQ94053.1 hypothetical protein GCM10007901_30040 [Dyella acidisoli]